MSKRPGSTVTTSGPDPQSQQFINAMRQQALQGQQAAMGGGPFFTGPLTQTPGEMAAPFMNPYMQNVVDATRGEFDALRRQASTQAQQQATGAGAFGGSRAAVLQGARMGELDRAQGSQIAGLLSSGYQNALQQGMGFAESQRALQQQQMMEPLFRQQQALQMMNLGMGPMGTQTREVMNAGRNPLASGIAGATAGAAGGPWGAAIGAGLGLLGGSFG